MTTRTRTINVRIPPGVEDGQRIRLPARVRRGLRGAPSGDLYVTVHVRPDKVFGRDGDDLTVTVPVSFHELALGATLSIPTLEGGKWACGCRRAPRTAGSCGSGGVVACPSGPVATATCWSR